MNRTLSSLHPHEQGAVHDCVLRLHAALRSDIVGVWLFGSKARGEARPDSDIDLCVVLKDLQPPKRWRIREIAAQCSLEYDVLLNVHLLDQARWDEEVHHRGAWWRELQRDGVPLRPEAVPTVG